MSHVRRRPDLWSYISFSRPSPRSDSPTLPFNSRRDDDDPYEKPARRSGVSPAASFSMSDPSAAWNNPTSRSRYFKIAGFLVFALLVAYVLIPGRSAPDIYKPLNNGQTASEPAADTTACTKSFSKDKPITQYALMIDAGSTGSRIHVYKFNNCGSTPELESEMFEMTAKKEGGSGLSSYDADAEGAAKSLDVLMDKALKAVPESYRSCSPIAVKATAGLRKLGTEKSERILKAVRQRLETVYPFPIISDAKGGVQVMDGKDEGIYAWITTNYLLGKIGGPDKNPTAAVFDLGGGSTQIVFQPTFPQADGGMPEKLAEGDHKYELDFGGVQFELYQHSYLGYGLMAARENLHQLVVEDAFKASPTDLSWVKAPLLNPCIQPGQSRDVDVTLPSAASGTPGLVGGAVKVTMVGPQVGNPEACRALAIRTLKKEAECKLEPCAFAGVHQPSLAKTFAREDVYLFSYFYDRTEPLGMPDVFTLADLATLTDKVCAGESGWTDFAKIEGALEELRDRPEHCLDLNFMLALLNTGYEMPMDREVRIAKKINGNELGWCLGASLPLLSKESGWQCRIKEVA